MNNLKLKLGVLYGQPMTSTEVQQSATQVRSGSQSLLSGAFEVPQKNYRVPRWNPFQDANQRLLGGRRSHKSHPWHLWKEESPATLQEFGSRTGTVSGVEPNYI